MKFFKIRLSNRAFTLVELGIAVVLASVISILLMTMMTRFQKTAVELSGRNKAAQDAIVIMYKLKNLIRNAAKIETLDSSFLVTFSDAKTNEVVFNSETGLIEWSGEYVDPWDKSLGSGTILGMSLKPLGQVGDIQVPRVFKLTLKLENPEARYRNEPTLALQKALIYSTIVSMRIPDGKKESDPSWVYNETDQCPPSCGDDSTESF